MIVNTDADNQYCGGDIPKLVAPILAGDADMVVGDRAGATDRALLAARRSGCSGSAAGSCGAPRGTDVPDTTSGFRAYNREAALQLQVVSNFTYTLETIIQAGKMLVAVDHVPIRDQPEDARVAAVPVDVAVRPPQRASRSSASTSLYEPLRVFMTRGASRGVVGAGRPGRRFLSTSSSTATAAATSSR